MSLLIAAVITFLACFFLVPVVFWLLRFFGFYAVVEERTCHRIMSNTGLPLSAPQLTSMSIFRFIRFSSRTLF